MATRGRPKKVTPENTVARPVAGQKKRVPLHQARDTMRANGLCPPDHKDRWVLVDPEGGKYDNYRLMDLLNAGWKFVYKDGRTSSAFDGVGDTTVNSSDGTDSRVTKRTRSGTYYYMIIEKRFYDEDKLTKAKAVDKTEQGITSALKGSDKYGEINLSK